MNLHILINAELCKYTLRIQIALKKLVETGIFLKDAIDDAFVFIMSELLQYDWLHPVWGRINFFIFWHNFSSKLLCLLSAEIKIGQSNH